MGYSSGDKAGRKGIETVCRVCQTNGAGPCGKEIIIGSVSVKHSNTIQKRKGGGEARGLGVPEATVQPQKAHEDPGTPQQHRPCQRMSVIRKLTEVIPWLSPAMQQASLLSAERTEKKPERGEAGVRREGCTGEPVSFFQPSLVRAHRHCPKITIALSWSFVRSCWQWLLTKRLDMERIWPPTLTHTPSFLPPPSVFFLLLLLLLIFGGGPPWTRGGAGLRFTCSIKGLKKWFEEAYVAGRGGSFGSDKKGLRHSEEQRKLQEKTKEEPCPPPISPVKQMLRQMAVN